jgi:hypothetical protein
VSFRAIAERARAHIAANAKPKISNCGCAHAAPAAATKKRVPRGFRYRRLGAIGHHAIWLVSGRTVRDELDVDFTTGGNPARYPTYVPKGEIWIEATMSPADVAATIVHELVELEAMTTGGLTYGRAHPLANVWERMARAKMRKGGATAPRTRAEAVEWAQVFLALTKRKTGTRARAPG